MIDMLYKRLRQQKAVIFLHLFSHQIAKHDKQATIMRLQCGGNAEAKRWYSDKNE